MEKQCEIFCAILLACDSNTTQQRRNSGGVVGFFVNLVESSISRQRAPCHIPNGEKAFVESALIVRPPEENTKTRHIIQHSEGLYCLTVAYLGNSPACFGVRAFLCS